jgi:hypothetical protein
MTVVVVYGVYLVKFTTGGLYSSGDMLAEFYIMAIKLYNLCHVTYFHCFYHCLNTLVN